MNVRRVQRLCSVKGCKNTASYAISRSKEYGGVIICKECLKEAYEAAKTAEETGQKKINTTPPKPKNNVPLFYHPENDKPKAADDAPNTTEKYICPECGKVCANAGSLASHMKSHEKKGGGTE